MEGPAGRPGPGLRLHRKSWTHSRRWYPAKIRKMSRFLEWFVFVFVCPIVLFEMVSFSYVILHIFDSCSHVVLESVEIIIFFLLFLIFLPCNIYSEHQLSYFLPNYLISSELNQNLSCWIVFFSCFFFSYFHIIHCVWFIIWTATLWRSSSEL